MQVVAAKMQQITMHEFLPALGITEADLAAAPIKKKDMFVSVEFATAAYRFRHDLVPDRMGLWRTRDIFTGEVWSDACLAY
jgi:hypothetical protein